MNYWDRNPGAFGALIFVLSAILIIFSITNLLKNITSVTDETFFTVIENNFYLKESIPAIKVNKQQSNDFTDTLQLGSIIKKINNIEINSISTIDSVINNNKDKDKIVLSVIDFSQMDINYFKTIDYLVKTVDFTPEMFRFIPIGNVLIYIKSGGVADRAGLKTGDIVFSINNQKLFSYVDYISFFQSVSGSSQIIYEILRDNKIENFEVKLARFGFNVGFISLFGSGMLLLLIGAFIGIKKPNLNAARLLSLALLLLGFVISIGFSRFYADFDLITQIRLYSMLVGLYFGLPLLYHSFIYFPDEVKILIQKQRLILVHYLFGSVFFVGILVSYTLDAGPLWFIVLFYGFMILGFVYELIIRFKYRKEIPKDIKRKGILIKLSFCIFVLTIIAYSYILPIYLNLQNLLYFDFGLFIAFAMPVSIIYTIARYRLLDLNLRIKRNIIYIIISTFINIILLFILIYIVYSFAYIHIEIPNIHFTGTSIEVLEKPLSPHINEMYNRFLWLIISIIFLYVIYKTRRLIFNSLNKFFHIKKVDFRIVGKEISKIFESNINIDTLANLLIHKLAEILQIIPIGIIFIQNGRISKIDCINKSDKTIIANILAVEKYFIKTLHQFNGTFKTEYLPDFFKLTFQKYKYKYIIPLRSQNRLIGAILIGNKLSEKSLSVYDFELLNSIATQCSAYIENASLYEELARQERIKQEIEIARKIQLASLPKHTPNIDGIDIVGYSVPAMEVGGDFYDYLYKDSSSLTLFIGDVSGKGTSAALYMSKIQGIIRTLYEYSQEPSELLEKANTLLYNQIEKNAFVTISIVLLEQDIKTAKIVRAGHLPIYYYSNKYRDVIKIIPKGMALGLSNTEFFKQTIETVNIEYIPGDIFILITDGILEARNSQKEEFNETRLLNIIRANASSDAKTIKGKIIDSLNEFAKEAEIFDDSTMVIVKIKE